MEYYLFIENDTIMGCGNFPCDDPEYKSIEVSEEVYNGFLNSSAKYTYKDGEIIERPKEELAEMEAKQRKQQFHETFFMIDGFGYYRKVPKGYASAMDSLNTAMNAINAGITELPAGTFIFYKEPDFTVPEQCTEEWLISNQVKSDVMSADKVRELFSVAIVAWNNTEH